MHIRTLFFFLAFLINFAARSEGAESALILKPLQFMCAAPKDLETLLDRKYKRPEDALRAPEVYQGLCMPMTSYERVFRLRNVQGKRHSYLCYQLWDTTNPLPPKESDQEFCSALGAVITTRQLFETRTGGFAIANHEKYDGHELVMARCHEGGHVLATRKDSGWERVSNLPINSPRSGFGDPVFVEGDLKQVLRDGCRAKDYL